MVDTTDLLSHAFEKNPVDFADTFNQLMQQRAQDSIAAHRITLAQSIYGEQEEAPVMDDEDNDIGEDEFDGEDLNDYDDDDLGDDLDLDDLDLDDLDLDDLDLDDNEGITDEEA